MPLSMEVGLGPGHIVLDLDAAPPFAKRGTAPSFNFLAHLLWPQQTWAENWGLYVPWGGAGFPSSTMWPGPRPISMPSAILVHQAVWLQ